MNNDIISLVKMLPKGLNWGQLNGSRCLVSMTYSNSDNKRSPQTKRSTGEVTQEATPSTVGSTLPPLESRWTERGLLHN